MNTRPLPCSVAMSIQPMPWMSTLRPGRQEIGSPELRWCVFVSFGGVSRTRTQTVADPMWFLRPVSISASQWGTMTTKKRLPPCEKGHGDSIVSHVEGCMTYPTKSQTFSRASMKRSAKDSVIYFAQQPQLHGQPVWVGRAAFWREVPGLRNPLRDGMAFKEGTPPKVGF